MGREVDFLKRCLLSLVRQALAIFLIVGLGREGGMPLNVWIDRFDAVVSCCRREGLFVFLPPRARHFRVDKKFWRIERGIKGAPIRVLF